MNLVFASGFLVPQHLLGINYFRDLAKHIEDAGEHAALFPVVDPLATCRLRARELADAIRQGFPTGPIHIIAHSMAGLDARVVIGENLNGLADPGRIVSLTTLSTPHRGSPVADLLAGPEPHGPRRLLYEAVRRAVSHLAIDIGALGDLTTQGAAQIPNAAQLKPHIRYRSYAASGRPGLLPTCAFLLATHAYIRDETRQDNDGLVSVDSARYGDVQTPPWPCDHADMVGHNLDLLDAAPTAFPHLPHYDAIIAKL